MYRSIRRGLAAAGAAGILAVTGAGAAHATTSYQGPVYPAPGGNTFTPSGDIASAGGETWTFGGFDTSQFGQMVWGPWDANSVKLSFDAASDTSYSQPGEVLQFDSADSDLANGKLVFTGHADMSIFDGSGYTPTNFHTRFTMLVTDSNTPISLVDPTSLGLDGGIGGQVSVNDNLAGYQVNMLFEASQNGTIWTPAKDLFNSIGTSEGTDPTTEIHTSFDGGFYYTPPAPPLTVTPQPYDFGSVAVGTQSLSQTFTVQNTSTNAVTLNLTGTVVVGDADEFHVTNTTCTQDEVLNAGDSCTVDFAFAPTSAGPASATFTLLDDSNVALGSFTLTGTGLGAASLSSSPNGLDFGDLYAGTGAKQTVTISNTGGADATSLGLAIGGPNAGAFRLFSTTCGTTLPANSSCKVTVRFNASGTGDRSATLTASSPGTSVAVELDGTSVASSDLAVDTSESPESPVPSGGQVTWTITVWDNGPTGAKGVSLTDALPAGTRFASATTSTGKCTTPHVGAVGTIICSLGGLNKSSQPVIVTITGTITASSGKTISDTATVSSKTHDPHPENNSATIDTDVS